MRSRTRDRGRELLSEVVSNMPVCDWCIYFIKRPGVYFISKSVKEAFKRGGRIFRAFIEHHIDVGAFN